MRIPTHDIPTKIETPGAMARQLRDFGDAAGTIGAEHFAMDAGTDLAPLLHGLDGNMCQAPHWGYIIAGKVVVDYADETSDTCLAGDVVHWPAGHSVRVDEDAEFVLFSPQDSHTPVLDHLARQLDAV